LIPHTTPEPDYVARVAPPSGPDLSQLDRLLGDVLFEAVIARTSRAVIYRIRVGSPDGRPLALKIALAPSDAEDLARFRHEVRLLSEARHPHVVEVSDFGVLPGDYPFLAMELLADQTLAEKLAGRGWGAFYDAALQAAAGLAHIHRQGVVHMDLKPRNLGLVPGEDVHLKILDFGLAQAVCEPLDRRIRGTLAYAAPEVLLQDSYDQRADLYSLGMTLYELATGVLPSAGDDRTAIRFHLEGEIDDPRRHRPEMPPELAEILRRLLRRDPSERYASAGQLLAALSQAAGRGSDASVLALSRGTLLASRLVGRDEILLRLRAALAAAAAGQGGVLVLEGGEGMGKSRLLREFRLLAAVEGARVARGRGLPERTQPLGPFLEAAAGLGVEVKAPFEAAHEEWEGAKAFAPGSDQGLGAPSVARPARRAPRPRERFRLYREISDRLTACAAGGPPVALLLDDLHLAGEESEEMLAFLAGELTAARVLVVATRRPCEETAGSEPGGSGVSPGLSSIRLAPLDRGGTTLLVDACLGTAGLPATFYDWVHAQAEGSPALTQQLLRHLVEDHVLHFRDGEWKPSLAALARWASAPGGLEAMDWQRLTALPEPEREVLEAASVIAEPFDLELLARLLGQEPQVLYGRLATLRTEGALERLLESGGEVYCFPRRRFRQALYGSLDLGRRGVLHRRLAEILETRPEPDAAGGERVAAVAEHFWRAGEHGRALPYLVAAAERATAVYGHAQAAALYCRAAEAAAERGEAAAAARLRMAQAEALSAGGSFVRALRVYHDLLRLPEAEEAGPGFLALVHVRKGRLHSRLGEHEAALESHERGLARSSGPGSRAADDGDEAQTSLEIELLQGKALALRDLAQWEAAFASAREALSRAGALRLERQRAQLLNTLGTIFSARGDWRRAGRLLRRALRVGERAGDEALCLTLRNNLGNVLWKTGDYEQALALYSRNLEHCERTRDPWGQIFALNNLGILECSRGNWRAALEPLTRSLEIKRRLGARGNEALALLNLGEVEEVLGNWQRAERHYARALKLLERSPEGAERFAALAQLASLDRKRGRAADAERQARAALAGAERLGDRDLLAHCYHQLGLIEKDRESWETAAEHLGKALELVEATGTRQALARVHISLADLALRRTQIEHAAHHAAEARRRVEALGDRLARGKLLAVEARLAGLRDDVDGCERLFAEGVRLFEELETPYEYARSLYEWGLRTWNLDTALERLGRALVAFERLGAENEARRTSGAVERIREHQRSRAGRAGADTLYEVVKVINSSLDLQQVLDRTMDLVLERLGAERGMIALLEPITRELELAVVRNLGQDDQAEGRKLSESVVRKVIDSREPILAADAMADQRFAGAESIVARHIVSILCVPLAIRDRLAGAIYVDHRRSSHLFGERDLQFLVAFADQAAIAIENARLYGEIDAARVRLKEENESLRREILSSHHLGSLIGKSRAIAELKTMLERVAQSPSTVLIRGESGTGKGLVARIIHTVSPRRQGPFVAFNCAALPETLIESELFGHEKGAFTGAAGQKPGRFELAHHGTIFIDEIGKVSRAMQAKLLRVVEDKEFERVGGTRTLKADVRIIAATNLDLEQAIHSNEFREDLYYRLNIIPIVLPPLRERREDVPYLVQHFLTKISRDMGLVRKELDPAVLDLFYAYRWPGNVRELEAAIHRALVLAASDRLEVADFHWIAVQAGAAPAPPESAPPAIQLAQGGYAAAVDRYDRQLVTAALAQSDGKIRETARLLGIARNTLKAKMKKFGLEAEG
jgi:Nif-specific regulatory protein